MAIPTAPHMAFAVGILGNIVSFLVYLAPLAMLLLYYGFLKTNGLMIITINTIGCAMEATYLILFMLYATKEAKRLVIRTKSVEYMPFALSFFLTLCAIMWFFYGFLIKDFYIATPNILGFVFGIAQMVLYMIYKENKNQVLPEVKLQDLATTVINLSTIMEMQENFKAGTYHVQEEHAVNEEANNKPVEASESNV
ncbi:nodulin MtN3 family protein [Actinidia rufa]|uniref:Sugar transporter SWEET1 n=1 Tax=Actinidia rufa TaxID=165716 RepID=A0A7J0G1H4_9ERIC|nr:nodulin MtN3 family protein [Actinidia rufa]